MRDAGFLLTHFGPAADELGDVEMVLHVFNRAVVRQLVQNYVLLGSDRRGDHGSSITELRERFMPDVAGRAFLMWFNLMWFKMRGDEVAMTLEDPQGREPSVSYRLAE